MNTTTLIAVLASVLVRVPRVAAPTPESYEWVAGEIRPGEDGYAPLLGALLAKGAAR